MGAARFRCVAGDSPRHEPVTRSRRRRVLTDTETSRAAAVKLYWIPLGAGGHAMTRARLATLIVGQAAVVARAAATPDTSRRYSRLGERLSSPER
jgi:hypothetical protein